MNFGTRNTLACALAAASFWLATPRAADPVSGDWPSFNRALTGERYAPFDQINRANVARLKQLCVYDLNVSTGFEPGLIVIGRTMYATTDKETLAIDAETCRPTWRVSEEGPSRGLPINRGAAFLDGRLFRGTGDGNVLGFEAATGKKLWSTHIADPAKGENITAAPIAWSGLVFIGTSGSDVYGVTGRVYGLDAQSGKVVWETYTVPTDAPQPGNEKMQAQARATWGNKSGVPITGGGTWTTTTLDVASGLLYVPVGNPGPDFAIDVRPGANLYTNSILVLDAKTGIYRKHYSLVPADFHDWDLAAAPVLVTTKTGRRIVAGAPKDGLLHVYNATTDQKLFATPVTTRENEEVPLSTTPTRFCPGVTGGTQWNGPRTARTRICSTTARSIGVSRSRWIPPSSRRSPARPGPGRSSSRSSGKRITTGRGGPAVDADTGQVKWRFTPSAPVVSGITPTRGGLVFAADMRRRVPRSTPRREEILWQTELPGAPGGGVIAYLVDGKQRVAFVTGTHSPAFPVTPSSAKIVVFGL